MASFRVTSALATFIEANITMANITALTNKPIIKLEGGSDVGTGDIDSGELRFTDEVYKPQRLTGLYRDELYIISATYAFFGSSETTFKEMIEEFDLIIATENQSITRAYEYDMAYDWDTNLNLSVAYLEFTLVKTVVDVTV